jgi:hypothetical protein
MTLWRECPSMSGISFDRHKQSVHAPCARIMFEALVTLILPVRPRDRDDGRGGPRS